MAKQYNSVYSHYILAQGIIAQYWQKVTVLCIFCHSEDLYAKINLPGEFCDSKFTWQVNFDKNQGAYAYSKTFFCPT